MTQPPVRLCWNRISCYHLRNTFYVIFTNSPRNPCPTTTPSVRSRSTTGSHDKVDGRDGHHPDCEVPAPQLCMCRVRGRVDEPEAARPGHRACQHPGGRPPHGREVRRAVPLERRPLHRDLPVRHAPVSGGPSVGISLDALPFASHDAPPRRAALDVRSESRRFAAAISMRSRPDCFARPTRPCPPRNRAERSSGCA